MPVTSQRKKILEIQKHIPILQKALVIGWESFQHSKEYAHCKKLYLSTYRLPERQEQNSQIWYDTPFYGVIPNPAHWYAAQRSGEDFLKECNFLGIGAFTVSFPGDFSVSKEIDPDALSKTSDLEHTKDHIRQFCLPVHHEGLLLGNFFISYPHNHETFYFTSPPMLSFIPSDD